MASTENTSEQGLAARMIPNPNSKQGYINRSEVRIEKGQLEEAVKDIEQALEISDNYSHAYLMRAAYNAHFNNNNQAIKDYSKAIQIGFTYKTDTIKSHVNRGSLYMDQGQYTLAIRDFNYVLELEPLNIFAHLNRGIVYFKQKNYPASLNDFEIVLKIYPAHHFALKMRADILRIRAQNTNE